MHQQSGDTRACCPEAEQPRGPWEPACGLGLLTAQVHSSPQEAQAQAS